MSLKYRKMELEDLDAVSYVMKRAFDDDSMKHLGIPEGGPPGYDNGDFFRTWYFGQTLTQADVVMINDIIIGAYIVWIVSDKNNILGTVFIDPDYQDKGYGSSIWKHIEDRYPDTLSWRLETPAFAEKNHYFYEKKCGFVKDESKCNNEDFFYYKIMKT